MPLRLLTRELLLVRLKYVHVVSLFHLMSFYNFVTPAFLLRMNRLLLLLFLKFQVRYNSYYWKRELRCSPPFGSFLGKTNLLCLHHSAYENMYIIFLEVQTDYLEK